MCILSCSCRPVAKRENSGRWTFRDALESLQRCTDLQLLENRIFYNRTNSQKIRFEIDKLILNFSSNKSAFGQKHTCIYGRPGLTWCVCSSSSVFLECLFEKSLPSSLWSNIWTLSSHLELLSKKQKCVSVLDVTNFPWRLLDCFDGVFLYH